MTGRKLKLWLFALKAFICMLSFVSVATAQWQWRKEPILNRWGNVAGHHYVQTAEADGEFRFFRHASALDVRLEYEECGQVTLIISGIIQAKSEVAPVGIFASGNISFSLRDGNKTPQHFTGRVSPMQSSEDRLVIVFNNANLLRALEKEVVYQFQVGERGSWNVKTELFGYLPTVENKARWGDEIKYEMISVSGGTFMMGCTAEQGEDCSGSERPAHSVTVSDFCIGKYPITQALWVQIMGDNPSRALGDSLPVTNVSWGDAQAFISRLNFMTGRKFYLPTEAEWEYAARGGAKSNRYKYAGSNDVDDVAWYNVNSEKTTHPVGAKKPNELGLYDMSGNVGERVNDWWLEGNYVHRKDGVIDPTGQPSGAYRVVRGGSWDNSAISGRVSNRDYVSSEFRHDHIGFRLVSPPCPLCVVYSEPIAEAVSAESTVPADADKVVSTEDAVLADKLVSTEGAVLADKVVSTEGEVPADKAISTAGAVVADTEGVAPTEKAAP